MTVLALPYQDQRAGRAESEQSRHCHGDGQGMLALVVERLRASGVNVPRRSRDGTGCACRPGRLVLSRGSGYACVDGCGG